jgi:oxygen-independent coproporphyrinogen-3 oxidase
MDADEKRNVDPPTGIGLYIHIPFCRTKCTYCDFTAFAGLGHRAEAYLDALERELETRVAQYRPSVRTVFFGGGTPSELEPEQLRRCLSFVRDHCTMRPEATIELEANPETSDPERLQVMRAHGVTRVSMGVQSFQDDELRAIARFHGAAGADRAVEAARDAGFRSISLDLMLGIPGQSIETWSRSLEHAIALAPDHVSCYGLTLEPATPLARQVSRGRVRVPNDDTQAAMYRLACERLGLAGYRHYEVSNWALFGHESPHNLGYWHGADYLGVGAGATSTMARRRWINHRSLGRYMSSTRKTGCAEQNSEQLQARDVQLESLMLGLRLAEGISAATFAHHYGISLRDWASPAIARLEEAGLVFWRGDSLIVPEEYWFILHSIVAELATAST